MQPNYIFKNNKYLIIRPLIYIFASLFTIWLIEDNQVPRSILYFCGSVTEEKVAHTFKWLEKEECFNSHFIFSFADSLMS